MYFYIIFHHYEKQTYPILKLETTIKDDVPSSTQPVTMPSKPPQATTIHSSPTHIPNNGKFKSKQPLGFLLYQTKISNIIYGILVPHIYKCIYLYRTLDGELEMKIETLEKKMEEMSATISELQEQISALYGKMMFLILLHFKEICLGYVKMVGLYFSYIQIGFKWCHKSSIEATN